MGLKELKSSDVDDFWGKFEEEPELEPGRTLPEDWLRRIKVDPLLASITAQCRALNLGADHLKTFDVWESLRLVGDLLLLQIEAARYQLDELPTVQRESRENPFAQNALGNPASLESRLTFRGIDEEDLELLEDLLGVVQILLRKDPRKGHSSVEMDKDFPDVVLPGVLPVGKLRKLVKPLEVRLTEREARPSREIRLGYRTEYQKDTAGDGAPFPPVKAGSRKPPSEVLRQIFGLHPHKKLGSGRKGHVAEDPSSRSQRKGDPK